MYIYNIERRIEIYLQTGNNIVDDDIIEQYKQANIIVFEHILDDYKTYLHNRELLSSANMFNYQNALKRAINTYILTVIKNAQNELGDTYMFVDKAHKDLCAIHNMVMNIHTDKNAPYARLCDSVIRVVPDEQYDTSPNMSHTTLLFHAATLNVH